MSGCCFSFLLQPTSALLACVHSNSQFRYETSNPQPTPSTCSPSASMSPSAPPHSTLPGLHCLPLSVPSLAPTGLAPAPPSSRLPLHLLPRLPAAASPSVHSLAPLIHLPSTPPRVPSPTWHPHLLPGAAVPVLPSTGVPAPHFWRAGPPVICPCLFPLAALVAQVLAAVVVVAAPAALLILHLHLLPAPASSTCRPRLSGTSTLVHPTAHRTPRCQCGTAVPLRLHSTPGVPTLVSFCLSGKRTLQHRAPALLRCVQCSVPALSLGFSLPLALVSLPLWHRGGSLSSIFLALHLRCLHALRMGLHGMVLLRHASNGMLEHP